MSKQKKKLNFQTVNTNNLFNEYLNKNIESINNNRNFIKPVNPMKKGAVENDAQDFLTKMVNSPLFADRYNVMRGYKASDAEVNSYKNHMINNMNKVQYWPTGVTYENKPWTEEDDYVGNYNKLYSLPKDEYNVDIMPDNPQWDYEDKRYRRQHMIFREHDSPMVTLHELSHASTNADGIPNQTYHPYSTDPLKKEDVEYYNSPDYRRSTEHKAYLDELRKYLYDNKIYDATNKVFDESDYENLIKENEKLNEKMKKDSNNIELKYIKDAFDKNILPFDKEQTIRLFNSFVNKDYNSDIQNAAMGGMIKRADGLYSQRGLWDNIRANKGSGKKPTKEMLEQEKKIKKKMVNGGTITNDMNNKLPKLGFGATLAPMLFDVSANALMNLSSYAVTDMIKAIKEPEQEIRPTKQNTGFTMAYGGMIDPSMYMQQMMYGSYAQGGQVPQNIPVEVEGQEMYEMPNGQMGEFEGPSHENGGIPVALPEGTKVYSDRLKVNGKTMADRKDKREKNIAKLEKLLGKSPHDKFLRQSLERQKETASLEEQSDMAMQEQANQQQAQQEQAMMQEQAMAGLMQDPAMMQQMGMMMYGGKLANGSPGTCPEGQYWNGVECVDIPNSFSASKTIESVPNTRFQKRNNKWKGITIADNNSQIPVSNTPNHWYDQNGEVRTRYNMIDGRPLSDEEQTNRAFDEIGNVETNPEIISKLNNELKGEAQYYEGLTAMQPMLQLMNPFSNKNNNQNFEQNYNPFTSEQWNTMTTGGKPFELPISENTGEQTFKGRMEGTGRFPDYKQKGKFNFNPELNKNLDFMNDYFDQYGVSKRGGTKATYLNNEKYPFVSGFQENQDRDNFEKELRNEGENRFNVSSPNVNDFDFGKSAAKKGINAVANRMKGLNTSKNNNPVLTPLQSNVDNQAALQQQLEQLLFPNVNTNSKIVDSNTSLPKPEVTDIAPREISGVDINKAFRKGGTGQIEPPGVNPYDVMSDVMGNTFGNIALSKDPYFNTKGGMMPNLLYNEVIGNKMLPEEDPKKPNRFMNFLNNAVDQTGDFFTGIFDKSGKPKKEKGTKSKSSTSSEGLDFTRGDILGLAGNLYGGLGPMMGTFLNRMETPKNQNFFREFGAEGLRAMQEAQALSAINRDKQLADIKLQEEAGRQRGRNSARGVNTLRALDIAADMGANQAQGQAYNAYAQQMMQMLGQKAQMENQQDQMVMQGETARDLADRQDVDNFYTNLVQNLSSQSELMQKTGRDLNTAQYNKMLLNMSPMFSKYGIGLQMRNDEVVFVKDGKTLTEREKELLIEKVNKEEAAKNKVQPTVTTKTEETKTPTAKKTIKTGIPMVDFFQQMNDLQTGLDKIKKLKFK
jgi:hypothetical protein